MSITFDCGNCGRSLTTAEDRAGQQAKCPGCGEVVTVPPPVAAPQPLDDDSFSEEEPASETDPRAVDPTPAMRTCPMCGMENPRKARKCQACGEAFPDAPRRDRRASRSLEVGEALSTTWDIFKDQLAVTVVSTLILMMSSIPWIVSLGASVFFWLIWLEQHDDTLLIVPMIALPLSLVFFLIIVFLSPGYSLLMLGVARGDDAGIGTLFQGGRFFLRSLFVSMIFMTLLIVGTAFCIVPGVLVFLMWWAYGFVLVDEDSPGISCLSRAKEIMDGRWSEVFLTLLVGMLINMFASQLCQILGLFSQAYFSLLMAVVYLRITGKLTARERPYAQDDEAGIDE